MERTEVMHPMAADPTWPRYSTQALPATRFVPGRMRHPRHDPGRQGVLLPQRLSPAGPQTWREHVGYLYGIDLYNFAFWWESHEVFEALWHAAGRRSEPGCFLQGLIQVAAGNLKRVMGAPTAAQNLWRYGLARLESYPPLYMGVDVTTVIAEVRACAQDVRCRPALIRLHGL